MSRLDWIPNKLKSPRHLEDFQRSWWREIVDAMFENVEMQGYLPKTDDLWRIAGARTRAFWNANCAAVTACFNSATVSGQEVIFYRPLLDLIAKQRGKLRGTKRARESPSNSPSQSDFDFDSSNQSQKKSSARARETAPKYSQSDFDARDLRRMKEANDELDRLCQAKVGNIPKWVDDEKKVFEWICQEAGITVERGLELEKIQKKWPEKTLAAAM